ncbi:MAG: hypothetical protein KJO91_13050 [Gammaproteobacteria bacterium]|nr:hypothetical protein [Gammaproteobacteria bacterium]
MTESLKVKRIRGASIFKIIVFGSALGCAVISTFFGIFALFGAEVVQWNEQYVTGIKGFLVSPFVGLFAGGFFGLFTSLFVYIGLRVYSMFRGMIIEYLPSDRIE